MGARRLAWAIPVVLSLAFAGCTNPILEAVKRVAGGGVVEPPVFSSPGGEYNNDFSITLSCATEGASIRYTVDGSVARADYGTEYAGAPISIPRSQIISAIAYRKGGSSSSVTTASYTLIAGTPSFTPLEGIYGVADVQINTTTSGAVIHYTTDGLLPTTGSPLYSAAIHLTDTAVVKAVAFRSQYQDSHVGKATYSIGHCAAPEFTVGTGTYANDQSVQIQSATPGASINYTLDGSPPSAALGTLYTVPVLINASATLKAVAFGAGLADSLVSTAVYTMKAATPTFSPPAGSYAGTQSVTPQSGTVGAALHYTTNGATPTGASPVFGAPIVVSSSTVVQAIATKTGYSDSDVGSATYAIPPSVATRSPAVNATGVSVSTTVSVTFNTDMDPATVIGANFKLMIGSTPVAGTVSYSARVATFTPSASLSQSTTYTATLTTGIKDTFGTALASSISWDFSTVMDALYVGTAGSDSNPGTKNKPKLTVQAALDLASSGTEVRVSQGTYSVSATITMRDGVALVGGYSTDFSTRNIASYVTTIDDTRNLSAQVDTIDIVNLPSAATRVDGFTINGAYVTGGAYKNSVVIYIYGSSPTIQNNKITGRHGGNSCSVVQAVFGSCAPIIRNNVLIAGASNYTMGIIVDAASPVIQNNTVYASGGSIITFGIRIYAGSHPTIDNNIISTGAGVGRSGIWESAAGTDADPATLRNNCIFNCPDGLYYDTTLSLVCTAVNAGGNFGAGSTWMASPTGSGNITDTPLFVNEAGGDYHLQAASPLNTRGGGYNLSGQYTKDRDGVTRTTSTPTGMTNVGASGWSIGAYEKD